MNQAEDQTLPEVANLSPARRAVPRRTFLYRMSNSFGFGGINACVILGNLRD